jgi:rubrerythrin
VRADMLYGIYQDALTKHASKVNVKSIIAEEEGHLAEMQRMLETFHPEWQALAEDVCKIENKLFENWINAIGKMERDN